MLDKHDAEAEEARRKLKGGGAKGDAGFKVSKQAPKNPRKYTKKAINEEVSVETTGTSSSSAIETGQSAGRDASTNKLSFLTCFINFLSPVNVFSLTSSENAAEVVKPKARAGSKKAPAKMVHFPMLQLPTQNK